MAGLRDGRTDASTYIDRAGVSYIVPIHTHIGHHAKDIPITRLTHPVYGTLLDNRKRLAVRAPSPRARPQMKRRSIQREQAKQEGEEGSLEDKDTTPPTAEKLKVPWTRHPAVMHFFPWVPALSQGRTEHIIQISFIRRTCRRIYAGRYT